MKLVIQLISLVSILLSFELSIAQQRGGWVNQPQDSDIINEYLKENSSRYFKLRKEQHLLEDERRYLDQHYPESSRSEAVKKEMGALTREINIRMNEANSLWGQASSAALKVDKNRAYYSQKARERLNDPDRKFSITKVESFIVKDSEDKVLRVVESDGKVIRGKGNLRRFLLGAGLTSLAVSSYASTNTDEVIGTSKQNESSSNVNFKSKDWAESSGSGELGAH